MKADNIEILKFLKKEDKFIIPVYQRDYAWKEENCRILWDDIINLKNKNLNKHFLGTIVSFNTGKYGEHMIIDGQQRLTTVNLLLLALSNQGDDDLKKTINDHYLVNTEVNDTKIKLKPNKQDREFFNALFDNSCKETKIDSNILKNYYYFF